MKAAAEGPLAGYNNLVNVYDNLIVNGRDAASY